jgi:hypothetical protein
MFMRALFLDAAVLAALSAVACSPSSSPATDAGKPDATSADGAVADATPPPSTDAAPDGPRDTGSDSTSMDGSGPESGPDGASDAAGVGRLYVIGTNGTAPSVAVYPASASGMPSPLVTITGAFFTGPVGPEGAAVDATANILYVCDEESVLVFPQGATTPARTITSSAITGTLRRIAADSSGNVYVSGTVLVSGVTTYGVAIFGPTASTGATPLATFSSTAFTTTQTGVAVDGSGNIYVANSNQSGGYNTVLEFAPGASGFATPIRTIGGGPNSHLGEASLGGIAIDSSNNVYVSVLADAYNAADSIEIYAPSVTGDQPPTREIVGSAAALSSPTSLALDASGNLYVSNAAGALTPINVFAPGANGNQAPTRTLDPTLGGTTGGVGITIGP